MRERRAEKKKYSRVDKVHDVCWCILILRCTSKRHTPANSAGVHQKISKYTPHTPSEWKTKRVDFRLVKCSSYWLPGRIKGSRWHPCVAHHLALRWLPTLLPVGCTCGEQRQSCRNRRWVEIGGKVGIIGIGQYTLPLSTLVAYLRPLREILMLRMTTPPSELLYLPIIHLDGAFIFREMNGESWVNEKRKGIHSLLAWKHMPAEHATIKLIKTRKSFNTMEALNLLFAVVVAVLVLQGARAVVLAIWMIVLLILGGVDRMVDFLLTRFENKVKVPPYEVKLPPVERLQRDRRVHWGCYDGGSIRPEMWGSCSLGPSLPFTRVCALPWRMFHCCTLRWMKKHMHGGREKRR